jgi:hypothetical protein
MPLLASSLPSVHAHAQEAEPAAKPAVVAPPPKANGKKPPLPVQLSVLASSPDPPWILKIENTSDVVIRVPADERLLSFELRPKAKAPVIACKLPKLMVPSEFDSSRELLLNPKESFTVSIDPRLYCFGSSVDKLVPGAVLTPSFGFSPFGSSKETIAAEGLDRPSSYQPVRLLKGEPFTLPAIVEPPPSQKKQAEHGHAHGEGGHAHGDGEHAHGGHHGEGGHMTGSSLDPSAPRLDVYVEQRVDATAGRDVVLTLRAVNEGERKLATVLRTRMMTIRVEELRADNRPRAVTLCTGQHAAHGVASELVGTLGAGRESRLAILVAEVCPKGTFHRPGLYRLRAELDTAVSGESLKSDPWLEGALARQSALVRVASARDAFHAGEPSAGPVEFELPPGANDNARPAPKVEPVEAPASK